MADGNPNQLHTDLLQLLDSSKRIEELLRKAGGMGSQTGFARDVAAHALANQLAGGAPPSSEILDRAQDALGKTMFLDMHRQIAVGQAYQARSMQNLFDTLSTLPTALGGPGDDVFEQAAGRGYHQAAAAAGQAAHNAAAAKRNSRIFLDLSRDLGNVADQSMDAEEADAAKLRKANSSGGSGGGSGGNSGLWKTAGIAAAVKFMLAGGTGATYGNYEANQQAIQSANQTNAAMFTALATAIFSPSKVLSAVRAGARFVGSGWGDK